MTKAAIIAKYGQAYYDAQKAKNAAAALRRYYEKPETRRSKERQREVSARWRSENRDRALALEAATRQRHRAKRDADPERLEFERERWRQYQRNAVQRLRDAGATEYAAWRAERVEYHKAWRERNRERVNEASRAYRERHQEYYRTYAVANQAKRRGAGPMDRKLVAWLRSQPCVDCGATERIEVGHIVPVCEGGTNEPENLIPQCRPCNRRLSGRKHRLAS